MDLISKEELKDYLEKNISFGGTEKKFRFYDMIDSLPSAFEGMTNGEVIQALFPNANYDSGRLYMHIINVNTIGEIVIPWRWWNTPYQKGGEGGQVAWDI